MSSSVARRGTMVFAIAALMIVMMSVSAAAVVEITHLANSAHGEPFNQALEQLAEQFNAEHPGIHVTIQRVSGNYLDRLSALIAAGTPPDVTHLAHLQGAVFIPYLADINDLAERDGIELTQKMAPEALAALNANGKQFGVPIFGQILPINYNKQLFDEAGLATPAELSREGNWTWDTFLSAAKQLTRDRDGDGTPEVYGTSINQSIQRNSPYVWQAGGSYFDNNENPTEATLLRPETVKALEWYTSLATVYNVAIRGNDSFKQGLQAMNGNVISSGPTVFQDVDFEWDVAPMPRGPVNNVTAVFMNNVQIVEPSPHKAEAWQWVKFLTLDGDAVRFLTAASSRTPVLKAAVSDYMDLVPYPPNRGIYFQELSNARTTILSDKLTKIQGILHPALSRVIDGQQDLKVALTEAQRQANAILQEE